MTDITNDELQAMELRCEGATKGPWGHKPFTLTAGGEPIASLDDYCQSDIEFCAHSRTDLPRLIAACRAQAEELARKDAEIAHVRFALGVMHEKLEQAIGSPTSHDFDGVVTDGVECGMNCAEHMEIPPCPCWFLWALAVTKEPPQ